MFRKLPRLPSSGMESTYAQGPLAHSYSQKFPTKHWQYISLKQILTKKLSMLWAGLCNQYSDWLRAGRSGDQIPAGARFSTTVQTDPGAHPACRTMGTGSLLGVMSSRGVMLTPLPLLVLWSRKSRAISLLPLWAIRPVQSLSACTRVEERKKNTIYCKFNQHRHI